MSIGVIQGEWRVSVSADQREILLARVGVYPCRGKRPIARHPMPMRGCLQPFVDQSVTHSQLRGVRSTGVPRS